MSKTMDDKLLLLEPKTILSNADLPTNVTISEPEIKLATYQHVEPDKEPVIKVSLVVTCCPKEDCEKCEKCKSCESCETCKSCETCEGCLCEQDCQ